MARLLIVDDEPSVVVLMRFVLEKAGHQVEEAGNGQIALQKLGVVPNDPTKPLPDLIVLDVMMPIVDGITVAKALHGEPRTAKLPILIVTAKGDMRPLFDGLPGVRGFFPKPFDPKALRDAVASALAEQA